jgi:hypothetical protein
MARYGVCLSETFEPFAGEVMVTAVDAAAAPAQTAIAASASRNTRAFTGSPSLGVLSPSEIPDFDRL